MFLLSFLKKSCFIVGFIAPGEISFAQGTGVASASATIMAPEETTTLQTFNAASFETNSKPGTIELASTGIFSIEGNIFSPATKTLTVSSFNIIGNYLYFISIPPTEIILKRDNGSETITVKYFPIPTNNIDNYPINQPLAIRAMLILGEAQPAGNYVSITPVDITLNYN